MSSERTLVVNRCTGLSVRRRLMISRFSLCSGRYKLNVESLHGGITLSI